MLKARKLNKKLPKMPLEQFSEEFYEDDFEEYDFDEEVFEKLDKANNVCVKLERHKAKKETV